MKQIAIIALMLLVGASGYFGYQKFANKNKSAQEVKPELIAHFQKSGITAQQYVNSADEQAYVDEFIAKTGEALKNAGISGKANDTYDGFILKFTAISSPVKIYVYHKTDDAQADYIKKSEQETKSKELDDRNNRPHNRKDFYINDNLLMQVDHYKVIINSYGNLVPEDIDIDQSELNKIVNSFKSY